MGQSDSTGPDREALRIQGSILDPTTSLYDLPAHFDRMRTLYEQRRSLGLFHIDPSRNTNLEAIYGWQFYDTLLERFARRLEALRGSLLSEQCLVALDGVHSDKFLLIVPETLSGQNVRADSLHEMAEVLRPYLRAHMTEERLGVGSACETGLGYALIVGTPFRRFERLVYQAVEEARLMSTRREEAQRARDIAELRRILADESIDTLFQSIVRLDDSQIIGFEALSRGPRRTALEAPAVLFNLSSELGVERELDRLCHEKALRRARVLGADQLLFLNSIPATLLDPAWQALPVARQALGRAAGSVVLEITERSVHEQPEELADALERLRGLGFRVSIDDIGTGAASFPFINRIKPDFTKLDVSLVRGIDRSLIQQEVLRSLIELCSKAEATVIAEGIETREELEVLREHGVQFGQGFYFSHPTRALPALTSSTARGD
ncbi:MAG: EAL domain-containing protein [Acidobacteria bacterium]|nr:EAL domain-containing protein [Acidobacteriota bacterium]